MKNRLISIITYVTKRPKKEGEKLPYEELINEVQTILNYLQRC